MSIIHDRRNVTKGMDGCSYRIGKPVNNGGFGEIFEGECEIHNDSVILKFIPENRAKLLRLPDGSTHLREVYLLKSCAKVPGVVKYITHRRCQHVFQRVGCQPAYCIVMEKLDNCMDLFDFISQQQQLSEAVAREIMFQLLLILRGCHACNVLHRDLKDENILINTITHQITLIDFGAGALGKDADYEDFDATGVYAPPEYHVHRRYNGKSAEIWTLGMLLFDMVQGDILYKDQRHVREHKDNFHWIKPDSARRMSKDCQLLIRRCLRLDATKRPALEDIPHDAWFQQHMHGLVERFGQQHYQQHNAADAARVIPQEKTQQQQQQQQYQPELRQNQQPHHQQQQCLSQPQPQSQPQQRMPSVCSASLPSYLFQRPCGGGGGGGYPSPYHSVIGVERREFTSTGSTVSNGSSLSSRGSMSHLSDVTASTALSVCDC